MKKLIITETQLKTILLNRKRETISEVNHVPEIIEEGFKEVVLGIAMLAGITLTGQNKAVAQSALENEQILNQVSSVLQDSRLEKVIDSLENAGMENAKDKINKNADRIEKNFDEASLRVTGVKGGIRVYTGKDVIKDTVNTYKALATKLKQGYAITNISQDTLKKMIENTVPGAPIVDSLSVVIPAGELLGIGDYILSDSGRAVIRDIFKQIDDQSGVVLGVRIESSTDKQRISSELSKKLVSLGYAEQNEGLSKIRNDQLRKEMINIGIPDSIIKQDIKWDEGKGQVGASIPQDSSARYVRIIIDVIKITDEAPEDVKIQTEEDVLVYNFELAKVRTKEFDITLKLPTGVKNGKTSKKKCSPSGCPTFR